MDVAVSAQQWPSAYLLTRYRPASISAGAVMPTACHALFRLQLSPPCDDGLPPLSGGHRLCQPEHVVFSVILISF